VHDLVVAALQEAGVDGAEGSDALRGQASSKADCVLLSNAHVKDALREALLKAVQACNAQHSSSIIQQTNGWASSKADRVLLSNAHVKDALWEPLL
jgi:hypothetical protein